MPNKSRDYRIVLKNSAGILDSEIVTVPDGEDEGPILKKTMIAFVERTWFAPGDTITISEVI